MCSNYKTIKPVTRPFWKTNRGKSKTLIVEERWLTFARHSGYLLLSLMDGSVFCSELMGTERQLIFPKSVSLPDAAFLPTLDFLTPESPTGPNGSVPLTQLQLNTGSHAELQG